MTKDGTDVVEQLRESSGTSSEANTPLETKQSLVLGDRRTAQICGRAGIDVSQHKCEFSSYTL